MNKIHDLNQEAFARLAADPDRGPIAMLNLLKFKPDGGAEEHAKYRAGIGPVLQKYGAKVVMSGDAATCVIGNGDWDMIAVVEYPSPTVFTDMVRSEAYQSVHHHREAGQQSELGVREAQVRFGNRVKATGEPRRTMKPPRSKPSGNRTLQGIETLWRHRDQSAWTLRLYWVQQGF